VNNDSDEMTSEQTQKCSIRKQERLSMIESIQRVFSLQIFFYFFKFYMLMQFMTMKHDAIYLNSHTEALCVS